MGIGNEAALTMGRGNGKTSLPLMGIGNLTQGHHQELGLYNSLPLMGIGNRSASSCSSRRPRTHYPSWGSETPGRSPTSAGGRCSLPLMGIGNLFEPQRRREGLVLITPHGDRKPAGVMGRVTGHSLRSLPLMGIGNRERRPAGRPDGNPLITPHGDRKPLSHWG